MNEQRNRIGPTDPVLEAEIESPSPSPVPDDEPSAPDASAAPPAPPAPPAAHGQTSYLPPVAPAPDPLLGQTLAGRYLIEKKLGEGGMGGVYLATHMVLEKHVALKVLHSELCRKPDLVERFMQEAKAASRIRHENVIDISDFGSTPEGYVFFAMELLTGHDLHEVIGRARFAGELLPWSRSKHIFLQICSALSAAHRRGIVHRDMKPENVYLVERLGDEDFVKLLDFGIAKLTETDGGGDRKLTRTGMLFGTPEYMSPEQARGEPVDHRIDVYAMGCILFQMVTGRVPFEADNFMGVLTRHVSELPPEIPLAVFDRIGAPRELAGVISQALVKDRAHRHQTMDELANAVRIVCGEAPVMSGVSGPVRAQRAPSVPAPEETMRRATPYPAPTATPVPASASASLPVLAPALTPVPDLADLADLATASSATGLAATESAATAATSERRRQEWTGKLRVPQEDELRPERRRSKLGLVLGALVLAGGVVAAVVFATRGGEPADPGASPADPGSGSGAGSAPDPVAVAPPAPVPAPPPAVPAVAPPVAPPPPVEAPLPGKVTVAIDSQPRGAVVKDLTSGAVLGRTPRTFTVTPGRAPRQYQLTLRGYAEAQIEIVPDREKIERTEALAKDDPARPGRGKPGAGKPGTIETKPPEIKPPPGGGSAPPPIPEVKPPPPEVKPPPPEVKPPPPKPEDDCPELPCLKSDPSRKGGGGG